MITKDALSAEAVSLPVPKVLWTLAIREGGYGLYYKYG